MKSPVDVWSYFVNKEIINIIVTSTNKYITSVANNFSRERDAHTTDETEIRALFGLLYLAGICHGNRINREDLWRRDGYGVDRFHLTMSERRFKFLLRCIRFDDKATRLERLSLDKLAPIRDIFEIFVNNCKTGYCLSEFVTIDEQLPAFRGKCSFRQYIRSKPTKYGIKIFSLCDAKMFFTSNMEVYLGKQPEGPYKVSYTGMDVVKRLSQHIYQSGRNITTDNWFTSVPLVDTLLRDHKLTLIGTLKKNKPELPIEFSKPKGRPLYSSMFGFTAGTTIVSYIPKTNKNVVLISSLHHSDEIDTGDQNKPSIITDYNNTKGGVDVVDKLCSAYDCARNTRRWPMVIFYHLLNTAGINSQIIYDANTFDPSKPKLLRRNFLRQLSSELTEPYIMKRASLTNLPKDLKMRLQDISGRSTSDDQENVRPGRCHYCSYKKNRRTRFTCFKCNKFMCLEHITPVCKECKEEVCH